MANSEVVAERKAALFIDFDNIFLGLRALDVAAAEAFATRPAQWLQWLEGGGGDTEPAIKRRFLVRNVYLNPVTFGTYRAVFTRSGFRAIDCPPLTGQGKNSADIYMVLDIVDALNISTRYDEFVVMSADADFTPVLQRLRAHDRRTTVVTAGLSAAAYRATCDIFVTPEQLAAASLGESLDADDTALGYAPALLVPPSSQAREHATARAHEQSGTTVDAVTAAVREAVRSADRPVVSAAAAHAALAVDPKVKESDWYGAGSFRAFLALYLDDLSYDGRPPGYVFDPARHTMKDIPGAERPELDSLLQQVSTVTGAPAITAQAYRTLFEELAVDLSENPFTLNTTPKRVRDRTDIRGTSVPRAAIAFVIKGLIYAGHRMGPPVTAESLAETWARNLFTLCANAQMSLTQGQQDRIQAWVAGAGDEPSG